jgi:acetyl-CoA carboxylase carboxyltransferase component
MDWQKEMDELRRREAFAEELGGAERVKRQHDGGRLTIRERVARLADAGTFHELGKIAGRAAYDAQNNLERLTPSNFIFGRARVDGRPVVIGGDDFTVRGGSADATIKGKHNMCERMAHDLRLPLIRLVEGSGGGGSVKTIETDGRSNVPAVDGWEQVVRNMGTIPRVALGLGSVAGLGAAHLAAAHYSVMIKDKSAMFVAGPPVVERLGQKLTKNELGGWEIQLKAGGVDDAVDTEEDAFACARRFLSYLPSSVDDVPPRGPQTDDPQRREEWLSNAIPRNPRKPYKMRAIVEAVVDRGSFFEMSALYGRAVITGFARLDGWPVAVMSQRSLLLRRRVDGRYLPEGRALRRHRADLPPADRLPGRLPGLPHRPGSREDGDDQAGRARDVGHLAVERAMVRGDHPQRFRRGRRRPPQREPVLHALRVAVGPLGLAAAGRRHRGGLSRRLDAAEDQWPRWPRSSG